MLSQLAQQKKWRDALSIFAVLLVLVYSLRIFHTGHFLVLFYILTASFILCFKRSFSLYPLVLFVPSLIGAVIFSAKSGFTEGYFSLLSPVISLGLAAGLYLTRDDKKYPIIVVAIGIIVFMFFLSHDRFSNVDSLSILRGSKNHLMTYALSLWFLAVYLYRRNLSCSVGLFFLISLFFAATLSTSLGAMAVAALGLMFYLFFKNKVVFFIVVFIASLFLYNISFHTFDWFFQTKLVEKFYRGSVRLLIWEQFVSDFSIFDIFIGRFDNFSININGYHYENLHSSFFLGVSKYGYFIIVFQYLVGVFLLFSKKIELLLKTFIFMLLLRSLYDTVVFSYGYVDWIFYLLLFSLSEKKDIKRVALKQEFSDGATLKEAT